MWKFFKSSSSPSAKEAELAQEVAKLGAEVRGYRDLVETLVEILSRLPKSAERVELSRHIPQLELPTNSPVVNSPTLGVFYHDPGRRNLTEINDEWLEYLRSRGIVKSGEDTRLPPPPLGIE